MQQLSSRRALAATVVIVAALASATFAEEPAEQAQKPEPTYRLSPGDAFAVQVVGEEDLSRELVVAPDGYVYYPFVGRLKVEGLTLEELNVLVTQELGKQLKRPRVALTLTKFSEGTQVPRIYILGQVAAPGSYPVRPGMKVMDALSAAGGFAEGARPAVARILRQGEAVAEVDLKEMMVDGDLSQNVELKADDVLLVPAREVLEVMVVGRVATPGVFSWREGQRVLEALSRAGGIAAGGDPEKTVIIREGERVPCNVKSLLEDGTVDQNVELRPGDVVVVPALALEELEVTIVGQVNAPGSYPLREGAKLLAAISAAGGPTELADMSAVDITRGDEKLTRDLSALLSEGKTDQNIEVLPGDIIVVPTIDRKVLVVGEVGQPGMYDIGEDATILTALGLAGGVRPTGNTQQVRVVRADEVLTADVRGLLKEGDLSQNVAIKPGDTVLVSEMDTAQVVGQVRAPGIYPLEEGARLSDILTEAGWPTEDAGTNNVAILRVVDGRPLVLHVDAEGLLERGDMAQNTAMKGGDIVVVPAKTVKKKLTARDILGYVSQAASMIYLLDRARGRRY